jgi:ribose transport system substrate-binding protein
MKKALPVIAIVATGVIIFAAMRNQKQDQSNDSNARGGSTTRPSPSGQPLILWYGLMPHPYMNQVEDGAKSYAKDSGVPIATQVGQEWTQANESQNIETQATMGFKGFSCFPGDPDGANNLFRELKAHGQWVVAYGGKPKEPTPASFVVATDIPGAASEACEKLIQTIGDKGNIIDVLETVTDVNTILREKAVEATVAKHPNVHIIQTINDMTQQDVAMAKINDTMTALGDQVDGIIATGYNPTVAAALILKKWNADKSHKYIHFVGIDTDQSVLNAIRDGSIDATIAQNPFGHGYISCAILKMVIVDGYKPRQDYQFINAGDIVVTKDNIDTFSTDMRKITDGIIADLPVKYLTK